ncbi:MAG: DUF3078 domain-containing protein [Rhodothermales bacterium]|nr:DUF3078 domain-containing protein [Rhodothermales bacterium]
MTRTPTPSLLVLVAILVFSPSLTFAQATGDAAVRDAARAAAKAAERTAAEARAGAAAADSTLWAHDLIANISGTQAGFQNWAEGGVNTLALSLGLNGQSQKDYGAWAQKHTYRLSFGLVKQDTLDFRKAEDLIRFASTFTYAGGGTFNVLNPVFAVTGRSQFASGFNFNKDPFGEDRPTPVKVSEFMSPATFTQSLGLSWKPREYVSQRLGIAAKETVVLEEGLRTLYAVSPDKSVRFELGIDAFTDFQKEIFTNVVYQSQFGAFAAFNNPDKPDIIWENALNMKVNSWLGVNLEWTVLYDNDVSTQAQFKEIFAVTVSYHFL